MKDLKGETQVATLSSVTYDKDENEVFVTFKVIDSDYKKLVLRAAKRDDIAFSIRGETLVISPVSEDD